MDELDDDSHRNESKWQHCDDAVRAVLDGADVLVDFRDMFLACDGVKIASETCYLAV